MSKGFLTITITPLSRQSLADIKGGGSNVARDRCPEVECTFSCQLNYCVCDTFNFFPGMCVNR
ncbi:hypothetical protein KTO58_14725 [Chitinophaga pendula]|uniref:hypothetical protein n=1 Tax=Chitinophaga TaxID=79328 RepID=UPI000BAF49CC|nr:MULTISPECIES: hypothetical protein [Chitinophaga]ASZ12015.1 hypothetical protein CK934_14125 [Chitinophaga sp. MD30]UCJ04955.1 hypothetical protein KTO58_14725 [Chitinophaga pendula]